MTLTQEQAEKALAWFIKNCGDKSAYWEVHEIVNMLQLYATHVTSEKDARIAELECRLKHQEEQTVLWMQEARALREAVPAEVKALVEALRDLLEKWENECQVFFDSNTIQSTGTFTDVDDEQDYHEMKALADRGREALKQFGDVG